MEVLAPFLLLSPLVVLGIMLLTGRCVFLWAGFTSMTTDERARWNVKKLGRAMGITLLSFLIVLLIVIELTIHYSSDDNTPVATWILIGALFAVAFGGLIAADIFLRRSPRFRDHAGSNGEEGPRR